MYNPTSLEEERISWRTVVYFNVCRPVRRILEALDTHNDIEEDDTESILEGGASQRAQQPLFEVSPGPDESPQAGSSPQEAASSSSAQNGQAPVSKPSTDQELQELRVRLLPLLRLEESLAERLSGGVDVAGSGKGSIFVRNGWQESPTAILGRRKRGGSNGRISISSTRTPTDVAALAATADAEPEDPEEAQKKLRAQEAQDILAEEVASILSQCQDDVKELWRHPLVRFLRATRKLRLEEWAE